MATIVFVFAIILVCSLRPQVDAIPREFYCYKICQLNFNTCQQKSCMGKFPAIVPDESEGRVYGKECTGKSVQGRVYGEECTGKRVRGRVYGEECTGKSVRETWQRTSLERDNIVKEAVVPYGANFKPRKHSRLRSLRENLFRLRCGPEKMAALGYPGAKIALKEFGPVNSDSIRWRLRPATLVTSASELKGHSDLGPNDCVPST
ncbi:hypothetical protein LSAT2_019769 [Lamellibrachia satsuma]|nr:hypothetical protein LSAT2_019769 [Lamellibrachia satsuma]